MSEQNKCKDSDYKLEFTLKQHTPIIHFQSDQKGATLRATELKPKLDRFLIEKLELHDDKGKPKEKFKSWFIVGQDGALDYKVRVEPNDEPHTDIKSNMLFFGNLKPKNMTYDEFEKIKKRFKEHTKNFKINIICFNSKLKNELKNHFKTFLANTNFGTRQSKGYGSFYIYNEELDTTLIKNEVYSFTSSGNNWEKDIALFYQFLRQGINRPKFKDKKPVLDNNNCVVTRFYCKPFIFYYVNNLSKTKYTWAKRKIKQNYFKKDLEKQQTCRVNSILLISNHREEYLVRDLFGLSTLQEWKSYGTQITKESLDKKDNKPLYTRFKSPITFKVLNKKVYFWANNTYKDFLGKEFQIYKNGEGDLKCKTPPDFNFEDFLKKILEIDLSKYIDDKYHQTQEYKQLDGIMKSLTKGVN